MSAPIDTLMGDKYRVLERIGEGSFGVIYRGTISGVLIPRRTRCGDGRGGGAKTGMSRIIRSWDDRSRWKPSGPSFSTRPSSTRFFRVCVSPFLSLLGVAGIPRLHWYGVQDESTIMVIDLLGPSLEELFDMCGRVLPTEVVLAVAVQLVKMLAMSLVDRHS